MNCRARRRHLSLSIDPWNIREPRGRSTATGMVAGVDLLSYHRVRRQRCSACTRDLDRQNPREPDGKSERQLERHRRSWPDRPDSCVRIAGPGRPSVRGRVDVLWHHERFPGLPVPGGINKPPLEIFVRQPPEFAAPLVHGWHPKITIQSEATLSPTSSFLKTKLF
jgi:hypothetical protein